MKAEEMKEQFLSDWLVFHTYEGLFCADFRDEFREDLDKLLNQRVIDALKEVRSKHLMAECYKEFQEYLDKQIKQLKQ